MSAFTDPHFYQRQNAWTGVYTRPIIDFDRERVTRLAELAGPGSWRILELGAGGGQTAVALAEAGHTVTALELLPELADHARTLAADLPAAQLTVIQADFYTADLPGPFDVVCYWDSFGLGDDEEQRRLLRRVAGWLAVDGCALLDVATPWHAAKAAGHGWGMKKAARRYGFDADGSRLTDTWTPLDADGNPDETQATTQSLRCYAPADLRLLLAGTGLTLTAVHPGGMMDYEAMSYHPAVPLAQAMSYTARLSLTP
ncbi:MAG: class I SAM-dependent methyltransferase [Caldilineaceae bacterium]|nr:class I SAM-dependent methyltransferase [Caldilineaceae bacterium]MBP8107336.1 class I SAM-dependent methyltransferase [Caldilineaceae bacterium]MBP8122612.1 class I SAM-dependent methyltransferase [Caldilineaceae bacterium]MBP9071174.1 class I SAM-dependent methyltransferase [Caldilineaceae bacterium]